MIHAGNLFLEKNAFKDANNFFSLRDLFNVGEIVEVVRQSDLAVDRFTQSQIEDGTLTSFCNGSEGRVSWWVNQVNPANNAVQTLNANRPSIVDTSGNLISFNGRTSILFQNTGCLFFEQDVINITNLFSVAKMDGFSGVNYIGKGEPEYLYGGNQTNTNGITLFFGQTGITINGESLIAKIGYWELSPSGIGVKLAENDNTPIDFPSFSVPNRNFNQISSPDPYANFNGRISEIAIFNQLVPDRLTQINNMKNYYNI